MSNSTATLDSMIATLRGLPERIRGTMPEIAGAVLAEFRKSAASQQSPDGEAWPPTEDGKPALVNAADKIRYEIHGTVIVFTVGGIEGRHSLGYVKGGKRRSLLPQTYHEPSKRAAAKAARKALAKAATLGAP